MAISANTRGAIYMSVSMAAFTLNDTAMKAVTQTMPLAQAIGLRGIIATAGLIGLALATSRLAIWPAAARDRWLMGLRTLAELGATLLFLVALVHMPLANLSAIMQSLPLAVTLAAALIFGEPIGWRRLTAIGIGFIGVLLIIRPGTAGFDIWSVMGLGSVACVVVRDLSTRRIGSDIPSVNVAIWASLAVAVMGWVGVAARGWHPVTLPEALYILTSSGFLIVGYMFAVMVMRVGEIAFVAPFRYTSLLWAIVLGWLAFGDLPDGLTLVGAAIVVAMGLYTLWRERKIRPAGR